MDVETLSRIQFALTAGFHFIFPPISIGLGLFIVIIEALWLFTKDEKYRRAAVFFLKIFGLIFAAGVMTGIVMVFQFGTNWPVYSNFVGDVFGSPLAIEAIFAFFLEASFLGIALWGWEKVGPKTHFFATLMVCAGAHLSSVWIIAANSFMQTPQGFELVSTSVQNGEVVSTVLPEGHIPSVEELAHTKAVITDFWAMVLSPSTFDRISHTLAASWLVGAFLSLGICAFYILRRRNVDFAKPCLKAALAFACFGCLAMLFTGHLSARKIAVTQPEKLAAFEGHYNTERDAGLWLFGWIDEDAREVRGVQLGGWFSYLAFGHFDAEVKGLLDLPSDEFLMKLHPGLSKDELAKVRPNYWAKPNLTFQFFRIMVYFGGAMGALCVLGMFLWMRGKLFDENSKLTKFFLVMAIPSAALPITASQLGWAAAEVGRQPWIVWHILKTEDAVTTSASAGEILFSIILFTTIFTFITFIFSYVFVKKVEHGPDEEAESY